MSIQRKVSYKLDFTFGDTTSISNVASSMFTPPELVYDVGSYKNQRQGHLNPTGNASVGTSTFTIPMIYNEDPNTTVTLIQKLYSINETVTPMFDIKVSMIENVDGDEKTNYIMHLINCKLSSLKYDDVGTMQEEVMNAVLTVQPRLMAVNGDEMS